VTFRTRSRTYEPVIRKATSMLNQALSEIDQKVLFCVSEGRADYEIEFAPKRRVSAVAHQALGYCDKANHKIYVSLDDVSHRTESELLSTLVHEMLHTIGIHHTDKEHSLMFSTDTGVRGVTQYDVDAVVRHLEKDY
jgi:hypothetical protein